MDSRAYLRTPNIGDVLLSDVLLETSETFLGSLENVIVLANSKAEIVLSNVSVGIGVELSRRNSGNADFLNEEPAELEVTRTVGNVGWEGVICWELDRGHVGQNKVSTLGVRVL